jgi:hypothetical protein
MGQLYHQHFHVLASQPCSGLLLVSLWSPGKDQNFSYQLFPLCVDYWLLIGASTAHLISSTHLHLYVVWDLKLFLVGVKHQCAYAFFVIAAGEYLSTRCLYS